MEENRLRGQKELTWKGVGSAKESRSAPRIRGIWTAKKVMTRTVGHGKGHGQIDGSRGRGRGMAVQSGTLKPRMRPFP